MKRLFRNLLGIVPTLVLSWTIVFGAMHLIPGDPVAMMLAGTPATDKVIEAERARLGLDRSIAEQYVEFVRRVVIGDFGDSFRTRQPVARMVGEQLPYTLQLAAGGFVVGLVLGISLGLIAGVFPHGWVDSIAMTVALAGVSLPGFWVAMLLIQVFATNLGWLPVLGSGFQALILPSIAVGLFLAAGLARLIRSSIIEVMSQDYIRTARAKGLPPFIVVAKHALRNALIPPVTLLGVQVALLIGGAVVTETVFARPGIGTILVQAVLDKDYPVVQAIVVWTTAAFITINVLIDLLYGLIDPRVSD
ncbi:MAG: ABC transporter permease [Proteobacteria bacterium]|nr:ABC transporter permease [Pseudomonadota bacterium]